MCVCLHVLCVGLFVDVKFCKNVQHNEKLHSEHHNEQLHSEHHMSTFTSCNLILNRDTAQGYGERQSHLTVDIINDQLKLSQGQILIIQILLKLSVKN